MSYFPILAGSNLEGFWVHCVVDSEGHLHEGTEVELSVADIGYFAYRVLEDFDLDRIDNLDLANHRHGYFAFDD